MTLSMYRASIPLFVRGLKVMSALLDKGEAHVREAGGDPEALVEARLAPDMAPLSGQIQRASDASKLALSRLTGVAAPPMEDNEKTLDDLRDRITRTLVYLESLDPSALEGSEATEVQLKFGDFQPAFNGEDYLLGFALPNFYFHVTTAYAILRHQGVPVGKRDFLGPYP
jgi:hypothetical protein